jgi:hypothetical protein
MYAASSLLGLSTNTINSIPFIDGDIIITFRLTPNNPAHLTGVEPILPRTYTIS